VGRLGLFLQLFADLGQIGAVHNWTLEMVVVQPLRVFPGMTIGQISFWVPIGDKVLYEGDYAKTSLPLESKNLID
jgi:dCTP deaminase